MTGVIGGQTGGQLPRETLDDIASGESTGTWIHEYGEFALGLAYHDHDGTGYERWTDGTRVGVVDGAVTNLGELGWSIEDLFTELLDRPAETAAAIEGSFVIACQDPTADRQLVVTDKLGTRPVFYTRDGPFLFACAVGALLEYVPEPTTNRQAISDLLLMGHMWGDSTLVEEIAAVRPATLIDVAGGERTERRYWKPEFTEADPGDAYAEELTRRYRQAVDRTAGTLPSRTGIWLSGGIDSRTTTSAFAQSTAGNTTLETFTYDANPPTRDNPRIARQVADTIGVENTEVPLDAATMGQHFEDVVEATDGMHMWAYGANLAATYEIESPPPVMMEGMHGALLGDHLYQHHLTEAASPVESQFDSEASNDPEAVSSILTADVDPLGSFKAEASRSAETSLRETVLDVHYMNHHSRVLMPTNRIMRDRVDTRVTETDGDYLEWCAKLPTRYRKEALRVPGAPDGGIPFEPTRGKLALTRRIDPELADITYERSKVKPSRPYPVHAAGFVGNVVVNRLRSRPTYGNGQLPDFWIRETDSDLHRHVTRLVDDACDRSLFDADAVRRVYDQHMDGQNNVALLSPITTAEYWLQEHLD